MTPRDRAGDRLAGWAGPGTTFVLGLLCAVLAAALAAGVWWRGQSTEQARPSSRFPVLSADARDLALAQAGPLTEQVLSYGWRGFDAGVDRTTAVLDPGYAPEYAAEMAGLRRDVVRGRVTVTATASQVGVVSATADRAVALVFLDQDSTTAGSSGRRSDEVRVLVTLSPDPSGGGEWRVARLDAF